MKRTVVAGAVLIAALFTPFAGSAALAVTTVQTAAQLTPADAAPFIGDWSLAMEGPNGPGAFDLTVKVEKDKVLADITGAGMATQAITDVTKADKTLVLHYSFDYQGNAVDAAVSLTPAAEGKMTAQIDFAGGAYVMSGSATKKEKAK